MVPTELAFFEVEKEFIFADAVKLEEPMLSEAPKRFNTVDVVLSASKLVLMVMNAMMTKAAGHQAIVSFPAVGVNIAGGKHVSSENGHQLLLGAVLNDAHKHPISTLVKAQDGRFTTGASPSLASNPPWPKVAFINFDVSEKRPHF